MIAILKKDFSPYYKFSKRNGVWVKIIFKKGEKLHYTKRLIAAERKYDEFYVINVVETDEEYNMEFFNEYLIPLSEYRKLTIKHL